MPVRDIPAKSTTKRATIQPNPKPNPKSDSKPNTKSDLKPKPKPKYKPMWLKPKKDFISTLPDHILHKILSSVPLKQACRTTILSHRWSRVWASMQRLNFYKDEYTKFGPYKFIQIANSAILYRPKEDFQTFKTFLLGDSSLNLAKSIRWIDLAVKNEVQNLHIIIKVSNEGGNVILPRSVLQCESLVELSLFCFPNLKIITPSVINLKNLKTLSLQRMEISLILLEKILLGCPQLGNLNLQFCELSFSGIYSNGLRNLVMENCWIKNKGGNNEFFICAPNLLSLHFNQELRGLSLRWTIDKMFMLDVPNLKHLTLGGIWVINYDDAVPFFLKNSPKLEKLTLKLEGSMYGERESNLETRDLDFKCSDLKLVEIVCNDEKNEKIEKLRKVLERNGILDVKIITGGSFCEGDLLKELYNVWVWINIQLIDKTRVFSRTPFVL